MLNTESSPTLRDQFAMAALNAIDRPGKFFSDLASEAYRLADAMMEARRTVNDFKGHLAAVNAERLRCIKIVELVRQEVDPMDEPGSVLRLTRVLARIRSGE